MKFTRFLEPGSLELLNLRVEIRAGGCRHCHCHSALVSHGYLWGYAPSGHEKVTRGLRFFCSDRYSNAGCGRTFPVYWDSVVPCCTLRTFQLFQLVLAASAAPIHRAWAALPATLGMSVRSAYRWVAKWRLATTHIRARLCLVGLPPGKTDRQPDPFTLRHLAASFPSAACPVAAFQVRLQVPVTG